MSHDSQDDPRVIIAAKIARLVAQVEPLEAQLEPIKRELAELQQLQTLLQRHLPEGLADERASIRRDRNGHEIGPPAPQVADGGSSARDVVRRLLAFGPASIDDLTERSSRNPNTIRSAVNFLLDKGEVREASRRGRQILWMLAERKEARAQ